MKATDSYCLINESPLKGIILYYSNVVLENIKPVKLKTVISEIQTGKTPPKANSKYYESQDIDWFKPSDIGRSKYLEEAKEKFSEIALKEKKGTLYPKNTLLIIGIGGGVGRVSLLKNEGSSNQQITGILFKDEIFPEWGYYYYLVREDYIKSQAKSMSFPILNQSKIKNLEFKYPSRDEQIEVCKFLDHCWECYLKNELPKVEAFQIPTELKKYTIKQFRIIKLDEEIKGVIKTQKHLLTQLKQSILQEVIQGKLTEKWRKQNPDVEPASELLKRIKAEKAQLIKEKKIKKEKPLPPITEDEIPFEIPENWSWCKLGEINNTFLGGSAFSSSRFLKSSSNQVVRISNVKNDKLDLIKNAVFIDEINANENLRNELFPNDIIITMTGTRLKRDYCYTVLLKKNDFINKKLFLNQRVGCFRLNNSIETGFLIKVLKSTDLLEPVFQSSTGSANQANIGKNALLNILIPLPPFEEQKIIAEKVETLMKKCNALEQEITQSEQHVNMLMQAVLKEAFEGKKEEAYA
jgi:type I restriction enzyme S subunit